MVSGTVIAIIVVVIIIVIVGIIVYFAFFQGDDSSTQDSTNNNSVVTPNTTNTTTTDSTTGGTVDNTDNPPPTDGGGVNQGNPPESTHVILKTLPEKVKFVYPGTGKYIGLTSFVGCQMNVCTMDVNREDTDADTEWAIESSPLSGYFNIRNSLTNLYAGIYLNPSPIGALFNDRSLGFTNWSITDVDGGLITLHNLAGKYLAVKEGSNLLGLNSDSNSEYVKFELIEL